MYDALAHFCAAMRASGLEPPHVIEPGKLHRFPGIGKRSSNRAGWCILFGDGLGGCYGDWSSDLKEVWQAKRTRRYFRADQVAFARRAQMGRAQAEAQRNVSQTDTASRAAAIWNVAAPVQCNYPYLIRKRIQSHGARFYKRMLVLPVMEFTGSLTSLQFIDVDGTKRLLSGGRKQGCFIPVSHAHAMQNHPEPGICADFANCAPGARIIICEGWATGCTLAEDDPAALVLAAIDAGNLEPVAVAARCRWPSAELVIAGDDDRLTPGNPGATKAQAAAIASDALLALPHWPEGAPNRLSDFNDLVVWLAGGGA